MLSEQMVDGFSLLWERRRSEDTGPDSTMIEKRAAVDVMSEVFPIPADVTVTNVEVGGIPGLWLEPPDAIGRVLLYLHGGGYWAGSSTSHGELAARIARAAGASALIIDYRRAPEDPFPSAVEDAIAAYRWILGENTPASKVCIAGDSAGGGLAVSLLVALRDRGVQLPVGAALLSPWLDLAGTGESLRSRASLDPVLTAEKLAKMASAYLNGADPRTPLASPLYADLSGLPPLICQVGTSEILFDDAVRFAAAARAVDTPFVLDIADGLPHVWQVMANVPEAIQATERVGAFLGEQLVRAGASQ
jgi:epsilon-lactone hydrolase